MIYKKGLLIDTDTFKSYVKKPIPILAKIMEEEFVVETLEGTMKGKKGDYLVIGVRGELYPCDKDIFEETYDILGGLEDA